MALQGHGASEANREGRWAGVVLHAGTGRDASWFLLSTPGPVFVVLYIS